MLLSALLLDGIRYAIVGTSVLSSLDDLTSLGDLVVIAAFLVVAMGYLVFQLYYALHWNLSIPVLRNVDPVGTLPRRNFLGKIATHRRAYLGAHRIGFVVATDANQRILWRLSATSGGDRALHPEPHRDPAEPSDKDLSALVRFLVNFIGPGPELDGSESPRHQLAVRRDLERRTDFASIRLPVIGHAAARHAFRRAELLSSGISDEAVQGKFPSQPEPRNALLSAVEQLRLREQHADARHLIEKCLIESAQPVPRHQWALKLLSLGYRARVLDGVSIVPISAEPNTSSTVESTSLERKDEDLETGSRRRRWNRRHIPYRVPKEYHQARRRNAARVAALVHQLDPEKTKILMRTHDSYEDSYDALGAARLSVLIGSALYAGSSYRLFGFEMAIAGVLLFLAQSGFFIGLVWMLSKNRERARDSMEETVVLGLRPHLRKWRLEHDTDRSSDLVPPAAPTPDSPPPAGAEVGTGRPQVDS